jgi:NADH pyrophosphatase NudC (nudix superfamily)
MINSQQIRPLCKQCLKLPARLNGKSVLGFQRWHKFCNSCANARYRRREERSSECNRCGFRCEDLCQMCLIDDVTLCQNCNALRLKHNKPKSQLTVDATVLDYDLIIR